MAVRGVLLDLEGVLYQSDKSIPGATQTVRLLGRQGLALRFLTNTTTRPRGEVVGRLQAMGFAMERDQVFTPALAAGRLLTEAGSRRVHLAAPADLAEDFAGFELVDEAPDAVILGDLHKGFTWERLDGLFRMLLDGARLVALHRNRFCRRGTRLALDLGPFVAALEYAAGTTATVCGKPSEAFFAKAVADMGLTRQEVVMVGDDIEADIGGAQAAGLRAIQVETGKYSARDASHPEVRPSGRIASIAELPRWLSLSP